MTLTNSCCWPNSFSHLIVLLSTLAITISTNHLYHEQTSSHQVGAAAGDGGATIYNRRIDNKRYDNLFDLKTDINNLLFRSHGNLIARKRRATPNDIVVEATNLILNLSFANITDLSNVSFNENTASLNLSHNFLSTFNNASKLQKLTALDLSYNRLIGEFHLSGIRLATLDSSRNSLTNFSCDDCKCLQTLNLSHNALTKVSIDNLTSLQYLDLSANLLDAIEPTLLRNKSNLSDLILACNKISVINKDLLNQLGKLRRLDLSHNDISDVESDAFSELFNLQILDLSFNRIRIASLQTLQNIPQLNRLSLAGNVMLRNALRAFAVTWSIMELDYSHVGLCQVPDSLAQSVRILNLYGNFLNTITSGDFESYPFLHKLILSYSNLTSIEEDALGRLEMLTILHLDHNKLTQIPPSLPASLIKLYMHNNLIMELHSNDLMNLINLQVLDLSNNNLIYMPQLTLPALITLSVRFCGLESVERAFLKTSRNLRQLLIDGNLIKCAQPPLVEIEQCYDMQTPSNEYINDEYDTPIDYDDSERKERHLNYISSYFPNDGGIEKCGQWWWMTTKNKTSFSELEGATEIVPNCWNEQKLITSFTRTNEIAETTPPTTSEANDNKFHQLQGIAHVGGAEDTKGKNEANLSSEKITMNSTNKASSSSSSPKAIVNKQSIPTAASMKNSQQLKVEKLAPVSVNDNKNPTTTIIERKALNNLILMKTKQFKTEINSIQLSTSDAKSTITSSSSTGSRSSNNDNVKLFDKFTLDAIKDNNKSKSNEGVNHQQHTQLSDNKSQRDENDDGANGPSLRRNVSVVMMAEGSGIEATDQQQQHMAINQTISEHWNAIRVESLSHPGLFIVFTISSLGILLTFVVVYVYRCNFINSARRHHRRGHNGSCEHINNEGGTRDALGDNFNEEIRSFTIETHNQRCGAVEVGSGCSNVRVVRDRNCNLLTTTSSTVNQCDLLPMDILNSTLSQSQAERSHLSMHLW